MDLEKRARRQSLRVIISEGVMVLAVIMMVIVLVLVVSGYWLNSDFEVERQGMLQISSIPTGASVEVDGESPWFQRTNTSKILSSGKHTVVISKDGYDTWSKTINISEGLLYKLNYPHLFLKERVKEIAFNATTFTSATVSPNRKLMMLINNTTNWSLVDLENDTIKPTNLNLSSIFTEEPSELPIPINLEILSLNWDEANEHVLVQTNNNSEIVWYLIDVKNPAKSLNLTKTFLKPFGRVSIVDHSAKNLLVTIGKDLYKAETDSLQLSQPIVKDVNSYDYYDSEIIYSANNQIGIIKNINKEPTIFIETESPAKVFFGRFYDTRYIYVIESNILSVYEENSDTPIFTSSLNITPSTVKVGPSSEFLFMNENNNFVTLDMESMIINTWSTKTNDYHWLDGHMIYTVLDGVLSIYDFDGLNYRTLSDNVSSQFPVAITNNKWLYYFSNGSLVREWLIAQ